MPEPNPLTDPMWSNAHLRLVHDGAEATRMPKVEAIGGSDVALRNLRVCYFNREGRYKCGQCEKCLRARVALRLCGAEERATSFRGWSGSREGRPAAAAPPRSGRSGHRCGIRPPRGVTASSPARSVKRSTGA